MIRKKVFSNKKMLWRIFFSVNCFLHLRAQCWFWEGLLRKYQMSCWFMFLSSLYIVQHSLFYNKHKSRPRQIRVNLSFYIIQIWFMLLYYLHICLFFLHFLNKHKYFPNHTNIGSMSPINVKGLSWFDLVNNKLENTWAP